MAYVAVKGGERAIDAAHAWLASQRRGDPALPQVTPDQVEAQLRVEINLYCLAHKSRFLHLGRR